MQRALNPQIVGDPPKPVCADEFAALLSGMNSASRVAVAVSGGPDSMALAICLQRWATTHNAEILALIVDHGLRPESERESRETKDRLAQLGLPAEILQWKHPPIITRLHATARKARYNLLVEACQRHGMKDLLLAHQREDQAETILMRLAKGSGVDGLAGIKAQTMMGDVRILRPFLSIPRRRLIVTCETAGVAFITDPSNQSSKFARGRLRRVMPLLEDEGLTVERLVELASRAAEAREALDYYTKEFLRVSSQRDVAGAIRIDLDRLRAVPRAIAARALTAALQNIHMDDYPPEQASLNRLLDAVLNHEEMPVCTLHGCLIGKTDNQATLMREVSAITDEKSVEPGKTVIWDGRWGLQFGADLENSYTVRPLGHPAHELLDNLAPDLRRRIPQGRARAGLPALWQGENLALIPSLVEESSAKAQLVTLWPPQ